MSPTRESTVAALHGTLSVGCNRQIISSDVGVPLAGNNLDWWMPAQAAESLFRALAVELGASQQRWHTGEKSENNEAASSGFDLIRAL